ncbi:hypothetical protein LVY72_21475 [Arthrobacter sp. I2-34]|uniref:Integral membrane protein n=1 Tax=Arthrobacter hankyongi TaxID=2904801 RepID=A0ABS9LCZ0_9MICC|nr:hypothetical protein [Arthrobacter hankyongi]MCG2624463.1 hypothetical protein [Arthrobacter hankyongi]
MQPGPDPDSNPAESSETLGQAGGNPELAAVREPVTGNRAGVEGRAGPAALPFRSAVRLFLNAPGTRMLLPVELLFLCFLAVSAVSQAWGEAAVPTMLVVAALVPSAVETAIRSRFPTWLHGCYFGFLLAGPLVGSRLGLYAFWTQWDKPVHTFSGVLVGCAVTFALGVAGRRTGVALPPFLVVAGIITSGGFAAAAWEIAEFTSDSVLGTRAQHAGLEDTMTDIICGVLGAVIVAAAVGIHHRGHPVPWVTSLLQDRDFAPSAPPPERL